MQEAAQRLEGFVRILEHLREPLLIASAEGKILAANVAGAEALATSVGALAGAPLVSFSPAPTDLEERLRQRAVERAFALRARDGRRFVCDAAALDPDLLLLRLSGGPEAEPRARAFADALARLSRVSALEGRALEQVAHAIVAQGVSSMGALAGGIFLVDEAGANLELKVAVNYPEELGVRYRLIP